ncbi:MAG: DHH family phosphoesterase [Candidatus Thermoplasmatota archaeon]|nr:DHH family phosphoesterase [Candidatus Thermoplasmatota archaeon]
MAESLKQAVELIKERDYVNVLAHYDGDGTSSAIILGRALLRMGIKFHISYVKELTPEAMKSRVEENIELPTIIVDAGSDQCSLLSEKKDLIILDHHFYSPYEFKGHNINARDYGIDGTKEACGATMAYLFALTADETNSDLFPFFMSGVISDKQDIGGLVGLNRKLMERFGSPYRKTRTINIAGENLLEGLSYSVDPFFGNLSGNREGTRNFLLELGIEPEKRISDLTEDEKRKLEKRLALELIKQKVSLEALKYLETDMIFFESLGFTSKEIAGMIDGNSKISQNGVVVQYFLGDSSVRQLCLDNWRKFRSKLIEFARQASKEMFSLSRIQYFYAPDSEMAGSIAGLLMLYYSNQNFPVIGFNSGDDHITKVSSRGTARMVRKGLNLSIVMRDACLSVGGRGGGHDIAAGGTIPKGKEREFLTRANAIVSEQLTDFGCK